MGVRRIAIHPCDAPEMLAGLMDNMLNDRCVMGVRVCTTVVCLNVSRRRIITFLRSFRSPRRFIITQFCYNNIIPSGFVWVWGPLVNRIVDWMMMCTFKGHSGHRVPLIGSYFYLTNQEPFHLLTTIIPPNLATRNSILWKWISAVKKIACKSVVYSSLFNSKFLRRWKLSLQLSLS